MVDDRMIESSRAIGRTPCHRRRRLNHQERSICSCWEIRPTRGRAQPSCSFPRCSIPRRSSNPRWLASSFVHHTRPDDTQVFAVLRVRTHHHIAGLIPQTQPMVCGISQLSTYHPDGALSFLMLLPSSHSRHVKSGTADERKKEEKGGEKKESNSTRPATRRGTRALWLRQAAQRRSQRAPEFRPMLRTYPPAT